MSLADFWARIEKHHAASVAAGEHDPACEWTPGFYLCNCSKRRREANGITTVPREDLDFPPPSCPRCSGDLDHDGDGWLCLPCHLAWNSSGVGDTARFTDDHGDLSRCTTHGIRAHVICQRKGS